MQSPKNISIESQLHLLVAVAGGIALLVATAAFVTNDVRMFRDAHVERLGGLARVLNTSAAEHVAQRNEEAARDLLAGLALRPSIEFACLFDSAGQVLATYRRPDAGAWSPPLPLPKGHYFRRDGRVDYFEPIIADGQRIGTAYFASRSDDLWNRRIDYVRIVSMVLIAAVAATQLIATRIGRVISAPITELAETARRISSEHDYSIRVAKLSGDEVATLYDAFNDMLDQIQEGERQLQEAHGLLEARVADRTRQLSQANEELSRQIAERQRAEKELETLHHQLLDAARRAGMAEIATGVLHNVGNVLNSVNVSATLVADRVQSSSVGDLERAARLLEEHADELPRFLAEDPRGQKLCEFLVLVSHHLASERDALAKEIATLTKNIDHIKTIVAMQQSFAGVSGVTETVALDELLEDALKLNACSIENHHIEVVREYEDLPEIRLDKQKLLQTLVNLVNNARDALVASNRQDRRLVIRLSHPQDDFVRIEIEDNGVGIERENLTRIFSHGFTTKRDGHGFGLHSCALAARELGGRLNADSQGPGRGAMFVLELPFTASEVLV